MSLLTKQQLHELIVDLTKYCPEAESDIEYLEAEFLTTLDYVEKLLCENEIHEQCIANIIDTKPGGSIEGQMIAATQACGRAEQRNEELEAELKSLKGVNDAMASMLNAMTSDCACWRLSFQGAEKELKVAEDALAALKKDARFVSEYINDELPNGYKPQSYYVGQVEEAARRIIEATKEGDNAE